MHKGDEVLITKSGRYYHYYDDDCPISSSILKGKKEAQRVKEEEAQTMGLTLCRHCAKEYKEDMRERQGCGTAAALLISFSSLTFVSYFI